MGNVLKTALALCLFATMALATDYESKNVVLNTGVICDEVVEVTDLIDKMESGVEIRTAVLSIPGCGWIGKPAMVTVTPVAPYESKEFVIIIGQLDFHSDVGRQYGWIAFEEKASVKPVGQSL